MASIYIPIIIAKKINTYDLLLYLSGLLEGPQCVGIKSGKRG